MKTKMRFDTGTNVPAARWFVSAGLPLAGTRVS
jgi:hypothetical protein